ncbi:MAG: hypothetical protein OXF74_09600 [Rhodobacteraceae bacterium]|nr:hypothetical protein [Paracoccaceae bacterium]
MKSGVQPRTSETAFNHELARLLRMLHPRWRETGGEDAVAAEQTGVFGGKSRRGLRPDIVIKHPGGLPIIIETEYSPARNVESEAKARLGEIVDGLPVEGVLAVVVPQDLASRQSALAEKIGQARFEYCLFTLDKGDNAVRWPRQGRISGSIRQLADAVEYLALSPNRLNTAAEVFEEGIDNGAKLLRGLRLDRPDIFPAMSRILHQEDSLQTTRMAVAIIANAFMFQDAIAGNHGIHSLEDLRGTDGRIARSDVRECWKAVLEVNYWPIFSLADELLGAIPAGAAWRFLDLMVRLATQLSGLGTTRMHDLSGQMFQRLITDRKFLATFYTLQSSASLLAGLSVSRMCVDWQDSDSIARLRVADLACGTGSLLSAAQHAISARHRREGGDDQALHSKLMEKVLIAADIMPAATHLTASTASSAFPGETFRETQIFTLPYGREDVDVWIGSLDLIADAEVKPIFGGGEVERAGGHNVKIQQSVVAQHDSCDLVIMNPPFTNPTNHERADVPVPSFAGFGTTADEQAAMSARLKSIRRNLRPLTPAGHGNAGLASNFIDLAHVKLRPGGCMALILPGSFAQGSAWAGARQLLAEWYSDVVVIAIAAEGSTDRAFSADTGMAEIIVLATRRQNQTRNADLDAIVCSLYHRPDTALAGTLVADAIEEIRIEESPASGRITLGIGSPVGSYLRAPFSTACKAFGIKHMELAAVMDDLTNGRFAHPQTMETVDLPVTFLSELGRRGVVHRDINGEPPRGPFDIVPIEPGEAPPEYPALWRHAANLETGLEVNPDSFGIVRQNCHERAAQLWQKTASRLHFNLDFQLNSQPLAACWTSRMSLGGNAWPNFIVRQREWELPMLLWANSSLGLMSFWWLGTRQQQGRSRLTISRLPDLSSLDPRLLNAAQLDRCAAVFEEFRPLHFLPANEAYRDPVRRELDRILLTDILGLDEWVLDGLEFRRLQWSHEPSVHGGKSTGPGAEQELEVEVWQG